MSARKHFIPWLDPDRPVCGVSRRGQMILSEVWSQVLHTRAGGSKLQRPEHRSTATPEEWATSNPTNPKTRLHVSKQECIVSI